MLHRVENKGLEVFAPDLYRTCSSFVLLRIARLSFFLLAVGRYCFVSCGECSLAIWIKQLFGT